MPPRSKGAQSAQEQYREAVATYVAAGGDESVQRVITAVNSLSRKLEQWYTRQLVDLDLSHGEWSVVAQLATADGKPLTPSRLADATNVAPSSMTHRLDKMTERGVVRRSPTRRTAPVSSSSSPTRAGSCSAQPSARPTSSSPTRSRA